MKLSSKALFAILILFITVSSSFAQRGGGRWNADPKEMAEKQTTQMTDSLALSEAQTEKIAEVNLLYANKLDEMRKEFRENPDADRSTMRTQVGTLMSEKNEELKKYLTAEQFEKWEKIEAQRAERRKGQRGERRKRGKKSSEDKS